MSPSLAVAYFLITVALSMHGTTRNHILVHYFCLDPSILTASYSTIFPNLKKIGFIQVHLHYHFHSITPHNQIYHSVMMYQSWYHSGKLLIVTAVLFVCCRHANMLNYWYFYLKTMSLAPQGLTSLQPAQNIQTLRFCPHTDHGHGLCATLVLTLHHWPDL